MYSAYQQDDWASFLHTAEFAYNNHHHPSINTTPFYANYGYHPVYTDCAGPEQVQSFPERLQHIHEVHTHCQLALEKAQGVYKRYADCRCQDLEFAIGDWVWLESYKNLSEGFASETITFVHPVTYISINLYPMYIYVQSQVSNTPGYTTF